MKVIIIRAGALGDTLMLMPAVVQLKTLAEIILVVRSPGLEMIRPYLPFSIDYEGPGWHQLFLKEPDYAHKPLMPQVDKVIAFLGDPDGRFYHNLKALLPHTSIHLFPPFPPKETKMHVALYVALSLQKTGLPIDPKKTIREAYRKGILSETFIERNRDGSVVLHPGSGSQKKNHPPGFWLKLMEVLQKPFFNKQNPLLSPFIKGGMGGFFKEKFIILLGPAEEQLYPFFKENLTHEKVEILFAPEREKLISILRQASLYIGHDSGITHLSAMLGTPTVALFKSSPVHQWRPLGPHVKVIEDKRGDLELIKKILKSLPSPTR